MPRRKYASKDFSTPREPGAAGRPQAEAEFRRVADIESHCEVPPWRRFALCEALVGWASERNDGWLRIVPDSEGKVHWKWRFTSGRWAGHYVYVLQKHETAAQAVELLAGKLDLVDAGQLKPSRDVYA